MNYNADVTHCSGYKCPFAPECLRAQLFEQWQNLPEEQREGIFPQFISSQCFNRTTNQCDLFIK